MGNTFSENNSGQVQEEVKYNSRQIFNSDVTKCMSTIFKFNPQNFDVQEILGIILQFIENHEKEANEYSKKTGNNDMNRIRKRLRVRLHNELIPYLQYIDTKKVQGEIARGSFGAIYKIKKQNPTEKSKVLKVPLGDDQDFLLEVISMIVYQCYKNQIMQYVPRTTGFRWPFPTIYSFYKFFDHNNDMNRFCTEIERVATDCWSLVPPVINSDPSNKESVLNPKHPNNPNNPNSPINPNNFDPYQYTINTYMSALVQVTIALHGLQSAMNFTHRDLHGGNVMINYEKQNKTREYKLANETITVTSNIKIYIIDLGQSCAAISRCLEQCDRSAFMEAPASSYDFKAYGQNSIDGCFKMGYDLRLFAGSLSYYYLYYQYKLNNMTSNDMRTFVQQSSHNFSQLDVLMIKLYIYAYDGLTLTSQSVWHNLYRAIYMKEKRNNIFKPEFFFKFLANFGDNKTYPI